MFDLYVHGGTSLINAVLALLDLLMVAFLVWFIKPGYGMATKTHIRSAKIILLSFALLSLLTSWSIFLVQLDGDVMRFTIGFLAMTLRFSILALALVWAWDATEQYLGCTITHWITCWRKTGKLQHEPHDEET